MAGFCVNKWNVSSMAPSRTCYFRIQKSISGGVGQFLEDLNRTYGAGILTCDFQPQEFRAFLRWLAKNYFRKCRLNGTMQTYNAASCIGRQPETDVWVFGEELQLKGDGSIVEEHNSTFIWVKDVFLLEEGGSKKMEQWPLPSVKLPLYSYALRDVIESLCLTLHDNAMAGVFTIAGMLLGLHYEDLTSILGYCPIPIVCGTNRLGKTKSAKAALSLIGNTGSFYSLAKDRFIPRLCSRSTLPPVLDDLKRPKVIEDLAVAFFNRGKDGTCLLESMPRTCPLITVNWETLDGLDRDQRVFGRLVLIPFVECQRSPNGVPAQQNAESKAEEVFADASRAVGQLVGLSKALDHLCKVRVRDLASKLTSSLPDLDDRCIKNYALLISLAEKVIELAEVDDFEPELALKFFRKVVYPKAVKEYQEERSLCAGPVVTESGEPLIVDLLAKCITVHNITRAQMLTCVNPEVNYTIKVGNTPVKKKGVAIALRWLLSLFRNYGGTPPPEDRIRREIRSLDIGDTKDRKQHFNKYANGTKISRASGQGVDTNSLTCVVVDYAAFNQESWNIFTEAFGITPKKDGTSGTSIEAARASGAVPAGLANGAVAAGLANGTVAAGVANGAVAAGLANGAVAAGVANGAVAAGVANGAVAAGVTNGTVAAGVANGAVAAGVANAAVEAGVANGAVAAGVANAAVEAGVANGAVAAGLAKGAVAAGLANGAVAAGVANGAVAAGLANGAVAAGLANGAVAAGLANGAVAAGVANGAVAAGVANGAVAAGVANGAVAAGVANGAVAAGLANGAVAAGLANGAVAACVSGCAVSVAGGSRSVAGGAVSVAGCSKSVVGGSIRAGVAGGALQACVTRGSLPVGGPSPDCAPAGKTVGHQEPLMPKLSLEAPAKKHQSPSGSSPSAQMDDSGICLEVESDAIDDHDLISTVRGTKRGSINDGVNPKKSKTASEKESTTYKYCSCKQQRTKKEEDGMVRCENKSRKKINKCPGNRYFHLKCLGLGRVPKRHPWYCPTCKARHQVKK